MIFSDNFSSTKLCGRRRTRLPRTRRRGCHGHGEGHVTRTAGACLDTSLLSGLDVTDHVGCTVLTWLGVEMAAASRTATADIAYICTHTAHGVRSRSTHSCAERTKNSRNVFCFFLVSTYIRNNCMWFNETFRSSSTERTAKR